MRGIVCTRPDGGVSITYPTPEIFDVMSAGGYWRDRPRGFVQTQLERNIANGVDPVHARRFVYAVAFGGVTEREAWGIIRDRDCLHMGTQHEIVDAADLPRRWFRDAWTRGHNGGPIGVDMTKARLVQAQKIRAAIDKENTRRRFNLFGADPIQIDDSIFATAIRNARDEEELRRIWPWDQSLPQ